MRVFVAGGAGVVGRRLIPMLIAAGHQVTATTRSPARTAQLQQLGIGYFENIDDVRLAARFVDEGAVPRDHGQIVGVIRKALTQELLPRGFGERSRFAG